ncbi:ABC transporter substrate-binding protein [Cytobacillus depressus]|uniref:ABC transporter substrate-binding protein n=1 Tax=Cytobacillus depressus TaxID=1602942 RepID=A0A6L3UX25_9BACI|nr:ABC transporter substrate-binding protein [Cytobacillus depressus]KAB2328680.1 ABC transporter substrate-binding protein [Cytobacillus depressus]
MTKNNKFYSLLFSLFLAIGLLTACGSTDHTKQKVGTSLEKGLSTNDSEAVNPVKDNLREENSYPFTFKDATDVEITIKKKPERIVSLLPSNTEITFALGLGDEVVGVNDYDTYPKEVEGKEKVGGQEFNVEKVLSLKPDLVLADSTMIGVAGGRFNQLRDAGITVVLIPASDSFAEVYDTIRLIAQVTGTKEKGEAIIDQMKTKVHEIVAKVSQVKEEQQPLVWVEIDPTLWTAGKGTFMNEMIELLHARNAAGIQDGWLQLTEEKVIPLNPEVIITTYGYYIDNPAEQVYSRTAWKDVTAVKKKQVYDVNSEIVNRPGPRLAEGLEEFAKAIYPEIFPK